MSSLTAAWRKLSALETRFDDNFTAEWGRLCNLAAVYSGTPKVINTTGIQSIAFDAVPAGLIQPGSRWKCDARGLFSSGGSAPSSVSFYNFWQSTSGTQIGELDVPAAGLWSGAANAGWSFESIIDWTSGNSAVADMKLWWRTASGTGNSAQYSSVTYTTSGLSGGNSGPSGGDMSLAFNFGGTGFSLEIISARVAQEA